MLPSTALDTLYKKVRELGERKYWFLFLGLVFLVVIFINGAAVVPGAAYQRLSQDPFTTRTDIDANNYWQETLLLPIVAYYLGLTGTITFNVLTFSMIAGAYLFFAWLAYRRWGATLSMIVSALLITSPLSTILLSWLGMPDGLTVLLTIPFIFTYSGVLIFFLAFLGATNHITFIITILEILILRWFARDRITIKHIILALIAIGLGFMSVKLFLYTNGIEIVSRLDFVQLKSIDEWIRMNMGVLPASLFSLFNIQWLALFICLILFYKKDKWFYSLVLAVLLINYGITFFTLDTTRVFSLLSWAILFICIFHSCQLATSMREDEPRYYTQLSQSLILIGMLSFITPRYFSWVGEIHPSPFFEWIGKLLN